MRVFHLLLLGLLALSAPAFAHDYQKGELFIDHPWARATPRGASVAGGFLIIENKGASADRLIGVSSEIAARFEIHESKIERGVATMRPLEKGLAIAPGKRVTLAPGGYHVMFMDLKRPLAPGERFKATLQFERAGAIEVEFAVEAMGGAPAGHAAPKGHSGH